MSRRVTVIILLVLSLALIGGAVFLAVVIQQQQAPDDASAAAVCCGGGTCNDGTPFGEDITGNIPHASCDERAADFCSQNNRGGVASGGGQIDCPVSGVQCPNPPNSPAVWCAVFDCPNGDVSGDGQCTAADGAGLQTYSADACPSAPPSGCGQVDFYDGGTPGQSWDRYCGHTFLGFGGSCNDTPVDPPDPICGSQCTSNNDCPTGNICGAGGTCIIPQCAEDPNECTNNGCSQGLNVTANALCQTGDEVATIGIGLENLSANNLTVAIAASVGNVTAGQPQTADIDLASQWTNVTGPGLSSSSAPWTDPRDGVTYPNAFGVCDEAGINDGSCPAFNAGNTVVWSFDVELTEQQLTTYQAGLPVGIIITYGSTSGGALATTTHTRTVSLASCTPPVDPPDPPTCGESCAGGLTCESGYSCNPSTNLCALAACIADPGNCDSGLCNLTPDSGESICGQSCTSGEVCIGGSQCNTTTGLCALPACIADPSSCTTDQCNVIPETPPQCGETCGTNGLCPTGHTCSTATNTCVYNPCLSNPGSCTANLCAILPDTSLFDDPSGRLLIGFMLILVGVISIRTGALDFLILNALGRDTSVLSEEPTNNPATATKRRVRKKNRPLRS